MALISVLPRPLDEPLPVDVLADLAGRAAHNLRRVPKTRRAHPGSRWHVRLQVTDHYDLWLIGWGAESRVDMHDHGGAAGALSVVHGELIELSPRSTGGSRRRAIGVNGVAPFEPDYRHAVLNPGKAVAVSAHVYSPPLSSMTFFGEDATPLRSEPVDLPGLMEDRRA